MSDDFLDLMGEVDGGREGRNVSIPMGFKRLSKYIGIRKRIYSLIFGSTGCLSGDTIVHLRRGNRNSHRKYRIEEAFYKQEGIRFIGRPWKPRLESVPKVETYMPDLEGTKMHNIVKIVQSGEKEVYEVITGEGKRIEATLDHRFMITETVMGEEAYRKLSELKVGDCIVCKAPRQSRAKGRKVSHREEYSGKFLYYPGLKTKVVNKYTYRRVYKYRAIYDAKLNGISVKALLEEVTNNPDHKLRFSNPKMVIHHIDENPRNNCPDNLQLMTKREHDSLHNKRINLAYGFVQREKIISIKLIGKKMTYDIICEEPYRNFLANGFVVHNSGKSAFVHSAYILNPLDAYIRSGGRLKFKVILFSQERSKMYTIAKWVSRRIFLQEGEKIPVDRMLGWWGEKLSDREYEIVRAQKEYLDRIKEVVEIIEGPQNPTGIYKYLREFAENRGKLEQISEFKRIYTANDENEIVIPIIDHGGLMKLEKGTTNKKEAIDRTSEYLQGARDLYGYSPVWVAQPTRNLNNPIYQKMESFEPTIDDIKESGTPGEAADIVLSLFDALRYRTNDPSYNIDRFVDKADGNNYFRRIKILKNTYGPDHIGIGMGFMGMTGAFAELPPAKDMDNFDYGKLFSGEFFLKEE